MALWQWSTTPANNASAGAIDWAEGQPPSTVNDSARQMMADVATWFQSPEWLNYGLTPTYVSGTQFTVAGNQTSIYSVGRRVKATVTAGVAYGTIKTSAYTSLTTVTVTWDSGGNLDSGLSEVDVGILNPLFSSLPSAIVPSPLTVGNTSLADQTLVNFVNNANNCSLFMHQADATFGLFDNGRSLPRWTSDVSGNFTATGNVTAYSDKRLKSNIETIDNALARVKKLNGVTYNRKDIEQGVRHMGLIAQDVQRVAPETVRTGPDGYLSVAYGNLVGLLVEAVKELAAEVETLKGAQ
jgi:hypothetical protein